jgi:xyloglucan-specific endo-beta-1,4-glucanase
VAQVQVAGYTWDLFTGYNGAMRVYSFVVPNGQPIYSFTADVKEFFNYLVKNYNFPESQQYMLSTSPPASHVQGLMGIERADTLLHHTVYQFGTEAFTGGPVKFTVPTFQADVL